MLRISKLAESNHLQQFEARGFCMEPFILEGDRLFVNTELPANYQTGDILLYRYADDSANPVAHRLIKNDQKKRFYFCRPDLMPEVKEAIPHYAIIGKVEFVLRKKRLIPLQNQNWLLKIWTQPFLRLWPVLVQFKNKTVHFFLPLISRLQNQSFYRFLAARLIFPEIHILPLSQENSMRFIAKIGGRFAGNADLQWRILGRKKIGWLTNLSVRVRYRGAGVAARLIEKLIRHAGLHELWTSSQKENDLSLRFFHHLGFQSSSEIPPGWDSNFTLLKKIIERALVPVNESEPVVIQKIRETLVRLHKERGLAPGIMIHPAFDNLWGTRPTSRGLFDTACLYQLSNFFKSRNLSGLRFLDIGSGDGRVVFLAADQGAHATGIESDTDLWSISIKAAGELKPYLKGSATLLNQDFFLEDFTRYDFLFYYIEGSAEELRLHEKLVKELRRDALLVTWRELEFFTKLKKIGEFENGFKAYRGIL